MKLNLKKLTQNPTKSREDSLITYLRKLKRDGIIDDETLRKILPSGSTHGVLYGLPKVDKSGCPFRPIVSSINTYYNLASYLVRVLQPISTNQFTVKDSFTCSFAEWAKTYNHNGEYVCSFDVVHSSPTFHLMRQYKSVSTNYMLYPIHQSYHALF